MYFQFKLSGAPTRRPSDLLFLLNHPHRMCILPGFVLLNTESGSISTWCPRESPSPSPQSRLPSVRSRTFLVTPVPHLVSDPTSSSFVLSSPSSVRPRTNPSLLGPPHILTPTPTPTPLSGPCTGPTPGFPVRPVDPDSSGTSAFSSPYRVHVHGNPSSVVMPLVNVSQGPGLSFVPLFDQGPL